MFITTSMPSPATSHVTSSSNSNSLGGLHVQQPESGSHECSPDSFVLSTPLGDVGLVTSLTRTEEKIAKMRIQLNKEWNNFGNQTIDKRGRTTRRGLREDHRRVYKRVGYFWKNGTGLNFDGRDRSQPWSAAFISSVHRDAGVGSQFKRSPAHARYIRDAIIKKKAGNKKAAYWGHRLSERAPQVGDMVCYSRQSGVSYDRQPRSYKSHADMVVAVRDGEIDVIGGNVRQSVTKKTLRTNKKGLLKDTGHRWFAVLEPRNL